jgi:hypothetical protein
VTVAAADALPAKVLPFNAEDEVKEWSLYNGGVIGKVVLVHDGASSELRAA